MEYFDQPINKLKSLIVSLNGQELEISTVKSIEFAYSNTRPTVRAQVFFEDLYDLNMITDWSISTMKITFVDLLDDMFSREFRVIDVEEIREGLARKSFVITLQDVFSYALSNSYISRSFQVPLNEALMSIASDLKVNSLELLEYDFSDVPYEKPYITSKNINSLTYFTRELYRKGFTFYQSKKGIHVKSLEDLIPSTLPVNGEFSDHAKNQYYMNRILDHDVLQTNRMSVSSPSTSMAYDPITKSMVQLSENPLESLKLNTKEVNLSEGTTNLEIYQSQLDGNQRNLDLKREYMDQNIVRIYCSGFIKNDINQVYDLLLKGNDTYSESQLKGNELLNGKYVSKLVQEKIILDSYVQMITLHRADVMDTGV